MTAALKNRIENLIAMAQLLERVDANPTLVGAQQYLNLVNTVKGLLAEDDLPDDALRAVLRACPASALLYENMHYDRSGLSQSPTAVLSMTGAGVILGTAAYMSPEQARGKAVDRRTDIWSFGCVLFECLTGRQLFEGETVSDLIAKILEREPDWTRLPPHTPLEVRDLLRRCLEKDAKRRMRDIGDARIELEEAIAARAAATKSDPAHTLPITRRS